MNVSHISRKIVPQFSSFSANFGNQDVLASFLQQPFTDLSALSAQIALKKEVYSAESRKTLVAVLQKQLGGYCSIAQQENIQLLAQKSTFTITTGHQLTLFGGPLYLIYKVLHVVRLCALFNETTTDNKLVPIFWMASEDHDFDEVKHARVFQHKLSWDSQQTGAVGRFDLSDFNEIYTEFVGLFEGKETAIQSLLQLSLTRNYAAFTQEFISTLFADFGVLVLQPDTPELKNQFRTVIENELFHQPSFEAVNATNKLLLEKGMQPQATVREINLFYLSNGKRKRIIQEGTNYLLDEKRVTQDQISHLLATEIENFSPNVILRPVYQETILPNLAYIGGGGEMAYWVQLKKVFEAHQTIFPLLQQRNSFLLLDVNTSKKIKKSGWDVTRFFAEKQQLRAAYLAEQPDLQIDFSAITAAFETLSQAMQDKTKAIDESLGSLASAETARMKNQIDQFEAKLLKQLKTKHEQQLAAIDFISERFLPAKELQERALHWLNFAPAGDFNNLFHAIYQAVDPFQNDLIVLDLSVD